MSLARCGDRCPPAATRPPSGTRPRPGARLSQNSSNSSQPPSAVLFAESLARNERETGVGETMIKADPVFLAEVGHAFQSSHRSIPSGGEGGNNLPVTSANLYNDVEHNNRISESPPHGVRAASRASLHAPGDAGPLETAPWPSSPAGVAPTAPPVTMPLRPSARFAVPRLLIPISLSRGSTSCGPDRSDHRHRGCRG